MTNDSCKMWHKSEWNQMKALFRADKVTLRQSKLSIKTVMLSPCTSDTSVFILHLSKTWIDKELYSLWVELSGLNYGGWNAIK